MKKKLLIVLIIILSFSENVYAKDSDNVESYLQCINGVYYNITWDKTKNSEVKKELINKEAIDRNYVKDVSGLNDTEKEKYKIISSVISPSCTVNSDGSVSSCPTEKEYQKYDIKALFELDENNDYKHLKFNIDLDTGKFGLVMDDIFDGKLKARLVTNETDLNKSYLTGNNFSGFLGKSNGKFVANNLIPSSYNYSTKKMETNKVYIEFYLNDSKSKCNDSYFMTSPLVIPSTTGIEIENPAYKEPNKYGCNEIKSYIDDLAKKGYIVDNTDVKNAIKENYASFCFKNKIAYDDYANLQENINKQFNDLKSLISTNSGSTDTAKTNFNDKLSCDLDKSGASTCDGGYSVPKRLIASGGGRFWHVDCWEEYSAKGDHAKLVYAGHGFTYGAEVHGERNCKITFKETVTLKPLCHYSCYGFCTWVGDTGITHIVTAGPGEKISNGPNEEFDSCINECDGGNYSQSCINTCYNEVYGEREMPEVEKTGLSLLDDSNQGIRRLSTVVVETDNSKITLIQGTDGLTFDHWSKDEYGKPKAVYSGDVASSCKGDFHIEVSSFCESHGGYCAVVEEKGPSGCLDDPWGVYSKELSQSASEYAEVYNIANTALNTGNYTIQISDSYLNNGGNAYTYSITPIITKNVDGGGCTGGATTVKLGSDSKETVTYCSGETIIKKDVEVQLVKAYLDRVSGDAIYQDNGKYKKFSTNGKLEKINLSDSDRVKKFYSAGNKYYTNLMSKNVNVDASNPNNIKLKQEPGKAEIAVSVCGFGTNGSFNTKIDCFYGVYNDTFCRDNCPDLPEDECKNGKCHNEGVQFIFRPIELSDVFPNGRNPRWNWTSNASSNGKKDQFLNYKIDPIKLTKDIQDKGGRIYYSQDEVDYEFTLTPNDLREIRRYNSKKKNVDNEITYVDYDMNCTDYNGREYCYSQFLDDYVEMDNMSDTERRNIAICNNTKSKQCND